MNKVNKVNKVNKMRTGMTIAEQLLGADMCVSEAHKLSDLIKAGYILPKKSVYTKADIKAVQKASDNGEYPKLNGGAPLTKTQVSWLVRASAVHHGTDWDASVDKYKDATTVPIAKA